MAKKKVKKEIKKLVDGKEVTEVVEVEVEVDDDGNEIEPEGDEDDAGDNEDGGEEESDPAVLRAQIKKLREENKKHRLKGKGSKTELEKTKAQLSAIKKAAGVEDEESPEETIKSLKARNAELEAEQQLRELESELEIPKESSDYFRFLLEKAGGELEEGEELSEEQLEEIVTKAKAVGGGGSSKKAGSTGLGNKNNPSPDGGKKPLTVEEFVAMNLGERSELYTKNQAEYDRLMAAARAKKLI